MLQLRHCLRMSALGAVAALSFAAARPALASDPLPNDSVAPPVNVNLAMFYNEYSNAGTYAPVRGSDIGNTHVATDVTVLRDVQTFEVGGIEAGAQIYLPYVGFLGAQKVAGAATTSHSGFAQPNLGVFFWPINNPATGTYLVISPWVSPPISSFSPNYTLNPTAGTPGNAWFEELEIGARRTLFGAQTARNLSLELWATGYLYQGNSHYKVDGFDSTYREQPTLELRAYLPYVFNPATDGVVSLGFFQSFGGKQTVKVPAFGALPVPIQHYLGVAPVIDTEQRTQESQLRLVVSSFVAPTVQVMGYGYYDVAAHGGTKQRLVGIRIIKLF